MHLGMSTGALGVSTDTPGREYKRTWGEYRCTWGVSTDALGRESICTCSVPGVPCTECWAIVCVRCTLR